MSTPQPDARPEHEATILIVDDNAELLEMMTFSMSVLGRFTILQATDGIEGLEHAMTSHPDCIVIDVMMPGLNGYQLVHALRGDPSTADIPLVILTALAQERHKLAGMVSGADQYLTKPVTPTDLILAIQQAMSLTETDRLQRLRHLADEVLSEGDEKSKAGETA